MARRGPVRVLGVLLNTRKFRSQVKIGHAVHAYDNGYAKAQTLCGINYTMKKGKTRPQATRTSRDVDCMACISIRMKPVPLEEA